MGTPLLLCYFCYYADYQLQGGDRESSGRIQRGYREFQGVSGRLQRVFREGGVRLARCLCPLPVVPVVSVVSVVSVVPVLSVLSLSF